MATPTAVTKAAATSEVIKASLIFKIRAFGTSQVNLIVSPFQIGADVDAPALRFRLLLDISGMAFVNYNVFFGGKFLNIFWTSLSRFFVFFSGLPDKSLLDAPLQISCLELPSNMLTIRVPTS